MAKRLPSELRTRAFWALIIFAAIALAIAIVGVAGVLAFSVSARTREFGIRLAIGSQRRHLLSRVIAEGAAMAGASAATFLSPHKQVALLEAEYVPAYHTTGRSAAIWIQNYGPSDVRALG